MNETATRSTKQKQAFCWQEKAGLWAIRNAFDADDDVKHGLVVYLVLTEIASDERAEVFTRRIGNIAERAGLSYRKTADVLNKLANNGLVEITENLIPGTSAKAPSTYRLLSVTLGTECARLGTDAKQPSVPISVNNVFNNRSKQKENKTRAIERFKALGYTPPSAAKIEAYEAICVGSGLHFLPITEYREEIEERLHDYEDLEELKKLFRHTANLVARNEWTRKSKTLRGILEDAPINEPVPEHADIPY